MCLDDVNIDTHPGLLRSNSVVKANGAIESINPLNGTRLATAGENKADDATLQQSPIVPVVMPPQSPQPPQQIPQQPPRRHRHSIETQTRTRKVFEYNSLTTARELCPKCVTALTWSRYG